MARRRLFFVHVPLSRAGRTHGPRNRRSHGSWESSMQNDSDLPATIFLERNPAGIFINGFLCTATQAIPKWWNTREITSPFFSLAFFSKRRVSQESGGSRSTERKLGSKADEKPRIPCVHPRISKTTHPS